MSPKKTEDELLPNWLVTGSSCRCPACGTEFSYAGVRNPSLRFRCPHCEEWIQWKRTGEQTEHIIIAPPTCAKCGSEMVRRKGKYGEFWGCSSYQRTKCRGKPGARETATEYTDVTALVVWEETEMTTWIDPEKAAQMERWKQREDRQKYLNKPKWYDK